MSENTNGTVKSYPCMIARDATGHVLVKSVTTGNRLAVKLADLSDTDRAYVDTLLPFGAEAKKIDLTAADMRRLKALADAQNPAPAAPKPAVLPTPVAKPTLNGISEHEAAKTLSVIGKSRALNGHDSTLPDAAQGLGKASRLAEAISSGLWQFTYDLPDFLSKSAKVLGDPWLRCPNPSQRCRIGGKGKGRGWDFTGMWNVAARDQGSAWLITGKTTNAPSLLKLIAHWEKVNAEITKVVTRALADPCSIEAAWCKKVGLTRKLIAAGKHLVKVRKLRVHDCEVERLYAEAKISIAKEIVRCRQSLTDSIATADKTLKDVIALGDSSAKDVDKATRARDSAVRGLILKAAAAFYAAQDSAALFDATQDVAHLLDGLKNAVRSARDSFNASQHTGKPSVAKI